MTDWTPPEAMVDEIVTQICSGMAADTPYREAARSTVRAILTASPIGELVDALRTLLHVAYSEMSTAEDDQKAKAKAQAALARARGETK